MSHEPMPQYLEGEILTSIITAIIIALISTAIQYLLAPKKSRGAGPDPASLDQFNIPTANEDRAVSEHYGLVLVTPNCIWYGDLENRAIRVSVKSGFGNTKRVVTGFSQRLSMVWLLGGRLDKVLEFRVDDDISKDFSVAPLTPDLTSPPHYSRLFNARTGDRAPINGSKNANSDVRVYFGPQTDLQSADLAYYAGQTGRTTADTPAYRESSLLFMNGAFIGDGVTSAPKYAVKAQRTEFVTGAGWDFNDIADDANPANVVYDVLRRFQGIEAALIDTASFQAAAAVLSAEGAGVSLSLFDFKESGAVIQEVLRHVDAVMFFDETIGRHRFKLIRQDYNQDLLTVLDDGKISALKVNKQGWEDTYTDIVVSYTSRRTFEGLPIFVHNPAARQALGYVKSKNYNYTYFTTEAAAQGAIQRLKRRVFFPLSAGSFEFNRRETPMNLGDVFKLDSALSHIPETLIRITGLSGGEGITNRAEAQWVQELWDVADIDTTAADPGTQLPPVHTLENPVQFAAVKDAPQESDLEKAVLCLCAAPTVTATSGVADAFSVSMAGDEDAMVTDSFSGHGVLAVATYPGIGATGPVDRTVGFTFNSAIGVNSFAPLSEAEWQSGSAIMLLDGGGNVWELVSVQEIQDLGGGAFKANGIIRDLWGTGMTAALPIGSAVWALPGKLSDIVTADLGRFDLSQPLTLDFQPFNLKAIGPVAATAHTYTFRPETPYPPDNLEAQTLITGPPDVILLEWDGKRRQGGAREVSADGTANWLEDDGEGFYEVSTTAPGIAVQQTTGVISPVSVITGSPTVTVSGGAGQAALDPFQPLIKVGDRITYDAAAPKSAFIVEILARGDAVGPTPDTVRLALEDAAYPSGSPAPNGGPFTVADIQRQSNRMALLAVPGPGYTHSVLTVLANRKSAAKSVIL